MRRACVLVGLIVACGGPATDVPDLDDIPEEPTSGARLKLARFVFADGNEAWQAPTDILDTQLGMACTPRTWSDDSLRCTPDLGPVFFLDAACTMPVTSIDERFAARTLPETCGELRPTEPVFERTGSPMSVTMLFQLGEAGCSRLSLPDSRPITVATATPLASSPFVPMHLEQRGAPPIQVTTLLADDGLVAPLALREAAHGVTCDLTSAALASELPCIAAAVAARPLAFADDTCAQPVLPVGDPTCPPPPLVAIPTFGCPQYFELDDEPRTAALYDDSFGTCSASLGPEAPAYWLRGRVDMPVLARGAVDGAGRVQAIELVAGDTRYREPDRAYDSELAAECELPLVAADGETVACHVVRTYAVEASAFADASCTEPLAPIVTGGYDLGCGLHGEVPPYVEHEDGSGMHLYRVGARRTASAYTMFGASCDPILTPTYERGEDLGTTRLATAVKRRDP